MNHIVDTCPLTEIEGGLNLLHEADDDTVIWLESTVTAAEVDLGMFSMFGQTAAPTKRGPHKRTKIFFAFLQHGKKPEILK